MTKTEQRAKKIKAYVADNPEIVEMIKTQVKLIGTRGPRGGHNARHIYGWSRGGYAWAAKAFAVAGIDCPTMSYWDGIGKTPSTSIPQICADVYMAATAEDE